MSISTEALFLIGFGVLLFLITVVVYWHTVTGTEQLLAAGRNVGVIAGTATILATWIAPPAILISSQVSYQMGLSGLFWFIIPNVLALVIFAKVAPKIKKSLPNGYTINQLFRDRSRRLYAVVTVLTFLTAFISFVSSVVGGASFLVFFADLSHRQAVVLVLGIILSYSLISGLSSSIITDVVQVIVLVVFIAVLVPWTISTGNGIETTINQVAAGSLTEIFTPPALWFGINISIVLLGAPFVSQFIWQRVFAIKEKELSRSFLYSGVVFFFMLMGLASLGLLAAGSEQITVEDPLLVSYQVMDTSLPASVSIFTFMILVAALLSTGDSALVACGSILTVDFANELLGVEVNQRVYMRVAMVVVALITLISTFLPFSFLDWVLLNAPIAIVVTVPVIAMLYCKREPSSNVLFYAMSGSFIVGFPVYFYGTLTTNAAIEVVGLVLQAIIVTIPILFNIKGWFGTASDQNKRLSIEDR